MARLASSVLERQQLTGLVCVGCVLCALKRPEEAKEAFFAAIESSPQHVEVCLCPIPSHSAYRREDVHKMSITAPVICPSLLAC